MDYLLRLKQNAITMHEYYINIKTERNISEMNTIEIAIFQKQKSKKASGKCHPCCNFVPQSRRLLTSDPDVFEIGLKIGERFEFPLFQQGKVSFHLLWQKKIRPVKHHPLQQ